jgi:dynein heavy chain
MNALTQHSFNFILLGDTGTSKTACMKKYIFNSLAKEKWEKGSLIFSATTKASATGHYLLDNVEKKRRGIYGPMKDKLVVMIDDINMPVKEKYGAQPPLELLRQVIDQGGLYLDKDNEFVSLVNVQFCAAMGIPGGGKSLLNARFMRHFNLMFIPDFSDNNLELIFNSILEWGFHSHAQDMLTQTKKITKVTISLYSKVSNILLPLPSKPHYQFNLRSVAEIFEGILMVSPETFKKKDAE